MSAAVATALSTDHDPAIAAVLERLYQVISFEEGGEPDWAGIEQVFSPHARITRVSPDGTDYLDPKTFVEMSRSLFELGAYTGFFELERARRVECFGRVAQAWSLYETRTARSAREPLATGINSIQLLREPSGWRVVGLLWDETHGQADHVVSELFAGGAR